MNVRTGRDHVEWLKSQDEANVGVPTMLANSPHKVLPKLCAAWLAVSRRLTNAALIEELPEGLPATERTRYLWASIEPDPVPIWAEAAGLPNAPHIERAMLTLLDCGIIFPDGEISQWAKRYMKAEGQKLGITGNLADAVL